ncbi:MAG: hypothetical protein U0527_16900 [Candidatus Eisenbacteria bacterium]
MREFGLKVRVGKPQVTYCSETIREEVTSEGKYDRAHRGAAAPG